MLQEEFYFTLNPINFIIISGVLQNFVIGGILFRHSSDNPFSARILSTTVLVVNLHLAHLMILDTNLDNLFPPSLWIPYSYLTAIGPLIYFYCLSLTSGKNSFSKKDLIHFIPVCIEIILQVIQIVYSILLDEVYYNTPLYFYFTPLIWSITAASLFWYLRISLIVLQNYEEVLRTNFSNLGQLTLSWLSRLLMFYRTLWMLWIPFIVAFLFFFRFQTDFGWPLFLGFIICLYSLMLVITYLTFYIGIEGIVKTKMMVLPKDPIRNESQSYSYLGQPEIDRYLVALEKIMKEEKYFLNENLTLRDLANKLEAEPNLVSHILNTHMKKSFYEFVNAYRIDEVKRKMNDPSCRHLTLLAIALDSGFNSKTSFNRVFKQMTGSTPSAFLKSRTDTR